MAAKKKVKKKKTSSTKSSRVNQTAVDRLIDSNIQLQHKMTDIMIGLKDLNENVGSLVHIFKSAGEHIKSGKYEDPMINKINGLLEQNKNLQKALLMLEKYIQDKGGTIPRSTLHQPPQY